MLFVNDKEAYEYYGRPVDGYYTDEGFVVEDKFSSNENYIDLYSENQSKCYLVYANVSGGMLYVAKNNKVTYYPTEAKLFTLSEAESKIKWMKQNGIYNWQMIKCR